MAALAVGVVVAGSPALVGGLVIVTATLGIGVATVRRGLDASTALSAYMVALFAIPAYQVLPPLKAAGAPALLIGLCLMGWWVASRMTSALGGDRARQPLRVAVFVYLGVVIACFGMAFNEPLTGIQSSSANRAVLAALSLAGVALFTMDGVSTLDRLHALVRRFVIGAGYVAFVAVLQFQNITDLSTVIFPGLSLNNAAGIQDRSGFSRVIGTTSHPIEAGVIFGVAFPLALHLLVTGTERRDRRIGGIVTALLAVAVPMTVSRTAPVILAAGVLVLVSTWTGALRRRALIIGACGVVAMRVMFPGLLGTVRSLFTYAGEDPSVTGRTEDYAAIFELFDRNPIFGIGPGTFLPENYFFLDNQFLGTAVEMGTLGLLALAVLVVTSVVLGVLTRRFSADPVVRDLAQALIASLLAGLVSFATFDALGFPMFAGTWFLVIGLLGALWRLVKRDGDDRSTLAPAMEDQR